MKKASKQKKFSKLKILRWKSGLTQIEVAKRLGVTPQLVCRWENGYAPIGLRHFNELSKLYGVSQRVFESYNNTINRI